MKKSKTTCHESSYLGTIQHPLTWVGAFIVSIVAWVLIVNIQRTYAGLTINTNVASIEAQKQLAKTQQSLNRSFQRISSGLRINASSDDATGLGISEERKERIESLATSQQNVVVAMHVLQRMDEIVKTANRAISNSLSVGLLPVKQLRADKRKSDGMATIQEMKVVKGMIESTQKASSQVVLLEEEAGSTLEAMRKTMADSINTASLFFGVGPRGKKVSNAAFKNRMGSTLKTIKKGEEDVVLAVLKVGADAEEELQRAEEYIRENEDEDASAGDESSGDEGLGTTEEDTTSETGNESE